MTPPKRWHNTANIYSSFLQRPNHSKQCFFRHRITLPLIPLAKNDLVVSFATNSRTSRRLSFFFDNETKLYVSVVLVRSSSASNLLHSVSLLLTPQNASTRPENRMGFEAAPSHISSILPDLCRCDSQPLQRHISQSIR